jgi:hypothetical protein
MPPFLCRKHVIPYQSYSPLFSAEKQKEKEEKEEKKKEIILNSKFLQVVEKVSASRRSFPYRN